MGPTERLLLPSWCIGWAGGQYLICVTQQPWGQKKLTTISPYQDYPIIPRALFKLMLHKLSTESQVPEYW